MMRNVLKNDLYRAILLVEILLFVISATAQEQREGKNLFNVENEAVQQFLDKSNSVFSKEASVFGRAFFDKTRDYRPDQPNCKTIEFADEKARSAKVWLSTNSKFKNADFIGEFALGNGKGTCTLRNFVPCETYYYKVVAEDGRILKQGSFVATGRVRMIAIDSGFNIRDLGGWKGLGGNTLKYGWIYRGGSLGGTDKNGKQSEISEVDKNELYRLGIRAQLDLRAPTDKGLYTGEGSLHSYSAGHTPLFDGDFNNTMTDYGAYNNDMSVVSDIAWIIYELRRGRPVYFNCRQGADRTGTIAFMLEGLLGCYEYSNGNGGNQMAMDYELTGFSQANLVDNWKVATSCRPAAEAYGNRGKLFRKILELKAIEPDIRLTTVQEKCYYYLNRYVGADKHGRVPHIAAEDLDWFIMHMLGMSKKAYSPFRPQWAKSGFDLKTSAEMYSQTVNYVK